MPDLNKLDLSSVGVPGLPVGGDKPAPKAKKPKMPNMANIDLSSLGMPGAPKPNDDPSLGPVPISSLPKQSESQKPTPKKSEVKSMDLFGDNAPNADGPSNPGGLFAQMNQDMEAGSGLFSNNGLNIDAPAEDKSTAFSLLGNNGGGQTDLFSGGAGTNDAQKAE